MTYDHWKSTEPDDGMEPPEQDEGEKGMLGPEDYLRSFASLALQAAGAIESGRITICDDWLELIELIESDLQRAKALST